MNKSKFYRVEITNTWTVEVVAKNEKEAERKVLNMPNNGYDEALDYNGAEIIDIVED